MKIIKILFVSLIALMLLSLGCINSIDTNNISNDNNTGELIGGQKDEQGCLGPAGFSYDANVGACVRSWELDETTKQAAKIAVDFVGKDYGLTVIEVISLKCPGCFEVYLSKWSENELLDYSVKLDNWVASYIEEEPNLESNVYAEYYTDTNELFYSIMLFAPRACDSYEVLDEQILESYPTQIVVNLVPLFPDMVCATVVTPVTIEGTISLDEAPKSITVKLMDETVISTEEILIVGEKIILPEGNFCTDEQKEAEVCTLEYFPVCGDDGVTYGNECSACASGNIEGFIFGECEE